jgi:hypothetical protein
MACFAKIKLYALKFGWENAISHLAIFPQEVTMSDTTEFTLRLDGKGRVTFGNLAKGVSSFRVKKNEDGSYLLRPMKEIPAREAWLYENPEALKAVLEGLADSRAGRVHDLGSFAQYLED